MLCTVVVFVQDLRPDVTDVITASLSAMDEALQKVYEIIGGLPHYTNTLQVCNTFTVCVCVLSMLPPCDC